MSSFGSPPPSPNDALLPPLCRPAELRAVDADAYRWPTNLALVEWESTLATEPESCLPCAPARRRVGSLCDGLRPPELPWWRREPCEASPRLRPDEPSLAGPGRSVTGDSGNTAGLRMREPPDPRMVREHLCAPATVALQLWLPTAWKVGCVMPCQHPTHTLLRGLLTAVARR